MRAKKKDDFPAPRYNFYRSRDNGVVYAAMSHPSGYEDKHPSEWEGVSDDVGRAELRLEAAKGASAKASRTSRVGGADDLRAHPLPTGVTNIEPVEEYPDPDPVPLGRGIIPPPPGAVEA